MKQYLHTYRYLISLGLASAFALILIIHSVQQNWGQVSQLIELSAKIDTLQGADTLMMQQQLKLKQLAIAARKIGSNKAEVDSHLAFGTYLDEICRQHQITIASLPQEASEQVGTYTVSSEHFRLSGGYHELLEVLYQLEYLDKIGSIDYACLSKQTIRQGRSKQTILLAEIKLKRLEKQS